jgi:prepilin-type N-terminal cleavage/methylation domain-containing protein
MRRASAGFTLLEVLLALLVLTAGLLGFAGTLGPVSALASLGRIHSRVAVVLASRISRLRTELQAGAPGCVLPAPGSNAGLANQAAGQQSLDVVVGEVGRHAEALGDHRPGEGLAREEAHHGHPVLVGQGLDPVEPVEELEVFDVRSRLHLQ